MPSSGTTGGPGRWVSGPTLWPAPTALSPMSLPQILRCPLACPARFSPTSEIRTNTTKTTNGTLVLFRSCITSSPSPLGEEGHFGLAQVTHCPVRAVRSACKVKTPLLCCHVAPTARARVRVRKGGFFLTNAVDSVFFCKCSNTRVRLLVCICVGVLGGFRVFDMLMISASTAVDSDRGCWTSSSTCLSSAGSAVPLITCAATARTS